MCVGMEHVLFIFLKVKEVPFLLICEEFLTNLFTKAGFQLESIQRMEKDVENRKEQKHRHRIWIQAKFVNQSLPCLASLLAINLYVWNPFCIQLKAFLQGEFS